MAAGQRYERATGCMQQYEIEVGGRLRRVSVARHGDRFAVTVDGRTSHVDAARIDAHTLSLLVDTVWQTVAYEVVVTPDPATGQLTVRVGGVPVAVTLNGRRRWGRKADRAGAIKEPQRLVAPMPGKVVRVLVKTGDAVQARQALVVVEAMKMENELRAARDGTVADVLVREGASVDPGALLVVVQ
jgi:biotin carboxyl carrier protein